MSILVEKFVFGGVPGQIALAVGIYLLISVIVGTALRRNLFEGLALGFLLVIASTDCSYYVAREAGLSLAVFAGLSIALLTFLVAVLRQMPILPHPTEPTHWWAVALVAATIWPVAWITNIVMPDPSAGYAIFQAWNPLYLSASVDAGKFLLAEQVRFGDGIAMQSLAYAADIFGPAALIVRVFGIEANAALYGAHIFAVLATLGVLSAALGNRLVAQIVFALLTLVFFKWADAYRVALGDNWGDNVLFLSGALTCYYLARHRLDGDLLPAAALAASFLVFGRNFGAFYFAVLGIVLFAMDYRHQGLKRLWIWLTVGILGTVFALKELIQVLVYGPYYPRAGVESDAVWDIGSRLRVIATDLGLLQHDYILNLPVPAVTISLGALAVVLLGRRFKSEDAPSIMTMGLPLLVAVLPVLLELLTGYRARPVGSKLYIVTIFLLSWYPAYLACALPTFALPRVPGKLIAAGALSACVVIAGGGYVAVTWLQKKIESRGGWNDYSEWVFQSYRNNNADLIIAQQIAARGPAYLENVRMRPILYFYYEPGIGLRYFLGGDITDDWDFWSVPVQERLAQASSLTDLMDALDWPNISVGYKPFVTPVKTAQYPAWTKFKTELENLAGQQWVREVFSHGNSDFYITSPIEYPMQK